jgi:hypothetical protein
MKRPANLARRLSWLLLSLAVLVVLGYVDWLPALKDLSRLKLAHRDAALREKNVSALAFAFVLPDPGEDRLLAEGGVRLLRSLPAPADDGAWLAETEAALRVQARRDAIENARLAAPGRPGAALPASSLLAGQDTAAEIGPRWAERFPGIDNDFQAATDPERFPWRALFGGRGLAAGRVVACRPLAIFISAPLPALLNFVNHCSWSRSRLEIVGLRWRPGNSRPGVLLICRGIYLVRPPSAWEIRLGEGQTPASLLIDSDSPLLWQPLDPAAAGMTEKEELP